MIPDIGVSGQSPVYCYRCGHLWMPKTEAVPRRCPRCHSSRWDVPERKLRLCKFCGTEFQMDSLGDPCPSCGRRQDEGLTDRSLRCNQCDYEWRRKLEALPKTCPMCRSAEWNLPKAERLMCQQCGHVWRSTVEHPGRCPGCRSKIWDQPLRAVRCQRCGHVWKMRSQRSDGRAVSCPGCGTRHWDVPLSVVPDDSDGCRRYVQASSASKDLIECRVCGERWYATTDGRYECPGCGALASLHDRIASTSMVLWKHGGSELTYVVENGYGCVYLWDGDVPVACRYIHEVLSELGTTIGDIVRSVNEGTDRYDWEGLADEMRRRMHDHERYMWYFEKRLSLSYADARILAMHFTGMGPEAIARNLSLDESAVSAAFDRIMDAYRDSGIIVDDTIYTSDPFSHYRCRPMSIILHGIRPLMTGCDDKGPCFYMIIY